MLNPVVAMSDCLEPIERFSATIQRRLALTLVQVLRTALATLQNPLRVTRMQSHLTSMLTRPVMPPKQIPHWPFSSFISFLIYT